MIRLITQDEEGIVCTYLLTASQIVRVIEWNNGSKSISRDNKFYENSTSNDALLANYIYLKVNKLKNGTHVGGIWKYSDNVYFPRFKLFRQKLVKLEHS